MSVLKKFIPFAKVDEAKREVWGIVTAEVADKEGETCRYAPTKENYKAWVGEFQKATAGDSFGNLREMHQLKAAGRGVGIDFRDEDKEIWMGFKVVDDAAWNKVVEKVYTGFSQGGEYQDGPDADGFYTAKPSEVSLVDNPCLGVAHFAFIRTDGSVEMVKIKSAGDVVKKSREEAAQKEYVAKKASLTESMAVASSEIAKGMYQVSTFARLLDDLSWLQSSALYEREAEGDNSDIPQKLMADLKSLCETFLAMAQEEAAELTGAADFGKGLQMTALQKAAAELSKAMKVAQELNENEGPMNAEKARKAATAAGLSGAALEKFVKDFSAEPEVETPEAKARKAGEAGGLTGVALDAFIAKSTGKVETLTKADVAQIVGETMAEAFKAFFEGQKAALPSQTSIPVTKGEDNGGKVIEITEKSTAQEVLKATAGVPMSNDDVMKLGLR